MKTIYLDLFSGISGDMLIGALVDLGVEEERLDQELSKLGLNEYHLHFSRGQRGSIAGVKFNVHPEGNHEHMTVEHGHEHSHLAAHAHGAEHAHAHAHSHGIQQGDSVIHAHHGARSHEHSRTFGEIKQLITQSTLSGWVKERAIAVFNRIAVAEGKIHGLPPEKVHFHEVGALDSIVDIVGACIGLEMLGKPRVLASRVVDGNGWIDCAHGRFPIPAPATLAILSARNIAVSQCSEPNELITPTGAALLAEFAEDFGPMRQLAAERIGFGLGTRENKSRPNVLRAILGESGSDEELRDWQSDTIAVLETNLDDIHAEVLGQFVETALAAGALDVFYIPVQMKKNRPGVLLTVLCTEATADTFTELMLRETSSFGVRRHTAERRKLLREFVSVRTAYGEVSVKIGRLNGKLIQASPEFESCKTVAAQANVPLKEVYSEAMKALK